MRTPGKRVYPGLREFEYHFRHNERPSALHIQFMSGGRIRSNSNMLPENFF